MGAAMAQVTDALMVALQGGEDIEDVTARSIVNQLRDKIGEKPIAISEPDGSVYVVRRLDPSHHMVTRGNGKCRTWQRIIEL